MWWSPEPAARTTTLRTGGTRQKCTSFRQWEGRPPEPGVVVVAVAPLGAEYSHTPTSVQSNAIAEGMLEIKMWNKCSPEVELVCGRPLVCVPEVRQGLVVVGMGFFIPTYTLSCPPSVSLACFHPPRLNPPSGS